MKAALSHFLGSAPLSASIPFIERMRKAFSSMNPTVENGSVPKTFVFTKNTFCAKLVMPN